MGLEMKVKRAVLQKLASRYKNSSKKGKGEVIRELIAITDYNLSWASWLLRNYGRKVVLVNSESLTPAKIFQFEGKPFLNIIGKGNKPRLVSFTYSYS